MAYIKSMPDPHRETARNYVRALAELEDYMGRGFGARFSVPDRVIQDIHRATEHVALRHVKVAVHAGHSSGPVVALWLVSANARTAHILEAPDSYIPPARVRDGVVRTYVQWRPGQKRAVEPYLVGDWRPSQSLDFSLSHGVVRRLPGPDGPGRIVDDRGRPYSLHRVEARGFGLREGDRVSFVPTQDITTERRWRWAAQLQAAADRSLRLAA